MKLKRTFDLIALAIAFVAIWAIFETQTSKYYELERRIGPISLQKMEELKEGKGQDSAVLIASSECPYCLHFQDNLYIFLKKLGGDSYMVNYENLSNEDQKVLRETYGLDAIPAIIQQSGGETVVLTAKDLEERGIIHEEW